MQNTRWRYIRYPTIWFVERKFTIFPFNPRGVGMFKNKNMTDSMISAQKKAKYTKVSIIPFFVFIYWKYKKY